MCRSSMVIFGAGGIARETFLMLNTYESLKEKYRVIAFAVDDEYYKEGANVNNVPLIRAGEDLKRLAQNERKLAVVICIGAATARKAAFERLRAYGCLSFPPIISPMVHTAPDLQVGEGSVIHSHCVISVNVKIWKCVFMNCDISLGHDVVVDDFVSIYPRCDISGNVSIGSCASIGAKSFVLEKKTVGENAVVAPGAIVLRNVPPNTTVMGNPAKIYLRNS